jgi:cell fate regulator YaaT (PSP1 superfamily)
MIEGWFIRCPGRLDQHPAACMGGIAPGLRKSENMDMGIATTAPVVIGVRFQPIGKLYHFDATAHPQLEPGDFVIVETNRGRQIGQIMGMVAPEKADLASLKPIKAPATARDLMMKKLWEAKEVAALIDCREAAAEVGGLEGVKWLQAQYSYDGSTLSITFTSEEEEVNTNKLRKRLEQKIHTRLELRRIGARDSAKMLGEYGACGSPRCCSTHLTEFSPISIKMAKAQGISLNPSEITGMCGRLRCCLIYEYEQYVEALKALPRMNKWVGTPHGEGKVIEVNALEQTVTVLVEDTRHKVTRDEIQPVEEMRALQAKASQGCSREGQGGACECGGRVRSGKPAEPAQEVRAQAEVSAEKPATPPEAPQASAGTSAQPRSHQGRRRGRRGRKPNQGQGGQGGGQGQPTQ